MLHKYDHSNFCGGKTEMKVSSFEGGKKSWDVLQDWQTCQKFRKSSYWGFCSLWEVQFRRNSKNIGELYVYPVFSMFIQDHIDFSASTLDIFVSHKRIFLERKKYWTNQSPSKVWKVENDPILGLIASLPVQSNYVCMTVACKRLFCIFASAASTAGRMLVRGVQKTKV